MHWSLPLYLAVATAYQMVMEEVGVVYFCIDFRRLNFFSHWTKYIVCFVFFDNEAVVKHPLQGNDGAREAEDSIVDWVTQNDGGAGGARLLQSL